MNGVQSPHQLRLTTKTALPVPAPADGIRGSSGSARPPVTIKCDWEIEVSGRGRMSVAAAAGAVLSIDWAR